MVNKQDRNMANIQAANEGNSQAQNTFVLPDRRTRQDGGGQPGDDAAATQHVLFPKRLFIDC
jgi:hypothetical protein